MEQFIGFNINSNEYMIPILKVREIITMPSVTALPHLPPYVKGVTNLRGSIIPILNLNTMLQSSGSDAEGHTVIVVTTGKLTFGIIVNGITGVVNADESDIEPPEMFFKSNVDHIEGVAKLGNKLIVLLNIKKILPVDDMSLLEDAIVTVKETGDGSNVEVTKEVVTMGGKVLVRELHEAKNYFNSKREGDQSGNKVYDLLLDFLDSLADHSYDKGDKIIEQLLRETDSDLFNEVGKITRKLHNSIEEFRGNVDSGLQKLTNDDVPKAIDKLQFVISKTEEAANNTMAIVERYFEESDAFSRNIEGLKGPEENISYLSSFKESLDNDMTLILTAQEFQDITGQTIKKVIDLVNHVEAELLRLITKFGMPSQPAAEKTADTSKTDQVWSECEDKSMEKISQSDVEALLNEIS